MNKSILSKYYKCTTKDDVGSLWAEIISIKIETKLSIIESNRTSSAQAHIHSTIKSPSKLNHLLLEVELYKSENPITYCHNDEEISGIGVFKHWSKSSTSNEFCYLSVQYKEKEYFDLIQLLNQAHSNKKMKLYINIDVLGLGKNCEYKSDEDIQNVLLVQSVEFSTTTSKNSDDS